MFSATTAQATFLYVDSDVPAGQTLVQWRRERNLEQAARRRAARRGLHRLVHLRTA